MNWIIHSSLESPVSVSVKNVLIEQRLEVVPLNGDEVLSVIWYANSLHNETFWALFLFFIKHYGQIWNSHMWLFGNMEPSRALPTRSLPGNSGTELCGKGGKLEMRTSERDYWKSPGKAGVVQSQHIYGCCRTWASSFWIRREENRAICGKTPLFPPVSSVFSMDSKLSPCYPEHKWLAP